MDEINHGDDYYRILLVAVAPTSVDHTFVVVDVV